MNASSPLSSLSAQFPDLDITAEADKFLDACQRWTILQQLFERRVLGIKFERFPLPFHASLGVLSNNGFYFGIRREDSEDDQLISVGHELGHTFEFEIHPGGIRPRSGFWKPPLNLESFCDALSERWLRRNTTVNLTRFLRRSMRWKDCICLKPLLLSG